MASFPAPQMNLDDVARAARLEELADRSARARQATSDTRPTTGSTDDPQAALAARLEQLARRRTSNSPSGNAPPNPGAASSNRSKRRHPAQGARIAALGLSLASTGGLAALFAVSAPSAGTQLAGASIVSSGQPASLPAPAAPAAPNAAAEQAPSAATTTRPAAPVADSTAARSLNLDIPTPTPANTTVQGGVFQNRWGNVQVEATFAADGSLIDVTTLQTPYVDGKSVRINDYAVPVLNTEALTAQSAQIDTVSGATYTSNDYRRSLQSAIDTARAAGVTAAA
jgi:uncharacterized protein with FMN-binding domain